MTLYIVSNSRTFGFFDFVLNIFFLNFMFQIYTDKELYLNKNDAFQNVQMCYKRGGWVRGVGVGVEKTLKTATLAPGRSLQPL